MSKDIKKNMKFHEPISLIKAHYKLEPNALKLLGYNLNKLKYLDTNMIEVLKEDLFKIIPSFRNKERLKIALESLKTQRIENLHQNLLFSVWISAVKETDKSYIFEFPQLLLNYLKPFIAKEMSNINLYYFFKLTKFSSLRLYKILSNYINTTKVYIVNYEELKKILNLDRSRENDNMAMIKKACDEISKKTNIKIKYIDRKMKNRKVEILTFLLEKNIDIEEVEEAEGKKEIAPKLENQQTNNDAISTTSENIITQKYEVKKPKKTIDKESNFERLWLLYPNKKDKSRISKEKKEIINNQDYNKQEYYLKTYLSDKTLEINGGWKSLKNGSTFFNQLSKVNFEGLKTDEIKIVEVNLIENKKEAKKDNNKDNKSNEIPF